MPSANDETHIIKPCLVLIATTFHPQHGTLVSLITAEKYRELGEAGEPFPETDAEILELADYVLELDHETLHDLIPALMEHHKEHVALEAQVAAQARLN